ncbi:hypothetical protein KC19_7G099900 [Ceratodon purpureus]|uniref:Uncharacterized protein n=1 Tax=Ceratodon purpureus TaxID=3225 RepID=A0A8T0H4M8_CERPU|nr:hypothetical protein KC19_7G099900 [Ceratodon purpureus]
MGKIIRDRHQDRDVDKEESSQFEEDKNLDLGNIHEDSPNWSRGIESQVRRDEVGQGEEHINLDKEEDSNTTYENLQSSEDSQSNKENVAEGKTEKVISDQGEFPVAKGVSLKEKEPEHFSSTHEQWPCLRCEQDNDDFARNISDQQQGEIMTCNHDEAVPNEWWHYFQYDDENEKFLPSGSQTQRNPKPDEHETEVVSYKPALECDSSQEGTTSETNTTSLHKLLQNLQSDDQEPRRVLPTLTERVEALRVQFDAVLERNKHLEEILAALTKKENALEVILDRQTQQISSIDERQVEQERVLLAPMRNIYIRQFHDLIRESISQKMSGTFIYARQMWALKQRVNQHERGIRERLAPASNGGDLWQFIKEAHAVAPKFFCKGNLWNKFLDLILEDEEQLRILGLSAAAVELTRYGRSPPSGAISDLQSSRQDANFRNELVFAEVVAGQSDELRPLYAELYEFFYKVPPETMYIKGEPDLPGQPVQVPEVKEEVVVL